MVKLLIIVILISFITAPANNHSAINKFTDKMKSILNEKLGFNDVYSDKSRSQRSRGDDKIVFIMPLSGRYETFLRFLSNFEDVSQSNSISLGKLCHKLFNSRLS